ncbi:DUF3455 domain-containing protein [Spirosoma endbachense]|uniref:DUF3455 domain-containing protein n=1 Tax=Spirosoma endbachense TaxID=2666025 RepID=A0A6P1W6D3_9BACT|nr:DUF3455 domain-containing protein [Spirosoma endbachense]QHW00129.1 DUF3455 domain-containing protein [Spirosoma endbachense]
MINTKLLWRFFGIGIFLAITMLSCTDHLDPSSPTPAQHIAASEQAIIPPEIELPTNNPHGNGRVATYFAQGVQKYKAREKAGSNPITYEWVFVAPEAELYDATNTKAGTHFVGPSWQLTGVNALIVGQAYDPPKSASKDPNTIDWLLLKPKSGIAPTGIFQGVDYIQRIATTGGKAPTNPPTTATETVDVPYTAVYRFSRINP